MQQTIQKLNGLGGPFSFEAMGVADYIAVKQGNQQVATIRPNGEGVIALGGASLSQVVTFLRSKEIMVIT